MINREARLEARAISQGQHEESPAENKVVLYGMLAKVLNPAMLDDKLHSDVLPISFRNLENMLAESLSKSAHEGLKALDAATQEDIHGLVTQRMGSARDLLEGRVFQAGLGRLEQGCETASIAETLTLRTIARQKALGGVVTEKAVYESARVPRSIASIHLRNLPMAINSYARWSTSEGGDEGAIFAPSEVDWDPNKGLSFVNIHEDLTPKSGTREKDPQIGCPATLVSGYIQRIHHIAATTALEAGLIKLS